MGQAVIQITSRVSIQCHTLLDWTNSGNRNTIISLGASSARFVPYSNGAGAMLRDADVWIEPGEMDEPLLQDGTPPKPV